MGFNKAKDSNASNVKSMVKLSKVSIVRDSNDSTLCVVDNGNIRMRFTTVSFDELKSYKHPLYNILVP